MPELYYGTLAEESKRRLYAVRPMREIESGIFDSWKLRKLGPKSRVPHIALFWWFRERNHTALSWHDDRGKEQTVFLPQLLPQIVALPLARELFGDIIPSAITFRVLNERRPYLHD